MSNTKPVKGLTLGKAGYTELEWRTKVHENSEPASRKGFMIEIIDLKA